MSDIVPYMPKTAALTPAAMLPQSIEQAWELADRMAKARMMPDHLKNSPSDCLRVIMKAASWAMDPWTVAEHTSFVNGRECLAAQLVHAIVNRLAPIDGRLNIQIEGEGQDTRVRVGATIVGDQYREKVSPRLKDAQKGNSPLWRTDPAQQLAYQTIRAWARLYVPDVIMGMYTPEEMQEAKIGAMNAKTVGSGTVDLATGEVKEANPDPILAELERQNGARVSPHPAPEPAGDASPLPPDAKPAGSPSNGLVLVDEDGVVRATFHSTKGEAAKFLNQIGANLEGLAKFPDKAKAFFAANEAAIRKLHGSKDGTIAGHAASVIDFADNLGKPLPDQADLLGAG